MKSITAFIIAVLIIGYGGFILVRSIKKQIKGDCSGCSGCKSKNCSYKK